MKFVMILNELQEKQMAELCEYYGYKRQELFRFMLAELARITAEKKGRKE